MQHSDLKILLNSTCHWLIKKNTARFNIVFVSGYFSSRQLQVFFQVRVLSYPSDMPVVFLCVTYAVLPSYYIYVIIKAKLSIEDTSFHFRKIIARQIGNRFWPKDMSTVFNSTMICSTTSVSKEMTMCISVKIDMTCLL